MCVWSWKTTHIPLQGPHLCAVFFLTKTPVRFLVPPTPHPNTTTTPRVWKRQYLRGRAVLDWCIPPAWPFLLRTAPLLCLMIPHPSCSAKSVQVCVCVHQAAILGATTQHLTPPLITLYLALSMCVSICVCVWERMKGPRRPLILNIDTLVSELHPVIPYAPLRDERWEGRMHGRWRKVRSEVRRGGRGGQEVRWAPRGDEGWGSRKESRWKRSTQSYNLREFLHW